MYDDRRFSYIARSSREKERIVQHQHNHRCCDQREDDTAGSQASALILDEPEAQHEDNNRDRCKGKRHANHGNPVQHFKQASQNENPP